MKLTPCLLSVLLSTPLLAQETPPPLPVPSGEKPGEEAPKLVPGVLPEDTDAEARKLWNELTAATLVAETERRKVASFRLTFDLRLRPTESESHDANNTTYSFLAPQGFVRYTLESGRENLRGPDGDYTVTADGERIKLEGREFKEDRRQIDEAVRIAKNFVALTDPGTLRIQKLKAGPKPPVGLPSALVNRASQLKWIEVVSPDFHLQRGAASSAGTKTPLFRVLLGLDPVTKRIDLAELREVGNRRTEPILIRFANYRALDGYQIPHELKFYEIQPDSAPRAFRAQPTSDLVLHRKGGTLAASLKPEDFRP